MSKIIKMIAAYRSAWLPPIIVMIIAFAIAIFLSHGRIELPFLYRFT